MSCKPILLQIATDLAYYRCVQLPGLMGKWNRTSLSRTSNHPVPLTLSLIYTDKLLYLNSTQPPSPSTRLTARKYGPTPNTTLSVTKQIPAMQALREFVYLKGQPSSSRPRRATTKGAGRRIEDTGLFVSLRRVSMGERLVLRLQFSEILSLRLRI